MNNHNRLNYLRVGVRLLALIGCILIAPAPRSMAQNQGSSLMTELNALDFDYRQKVADIERRALQQDDRAVVAAIKTRMLAIGREAPKPLGGQARSLRITATIHNMGELYVTNEGIQWRYAQGGPVSDITVNGVTWPAQFADQGHGKFNSPSTLPMNIGTISKWRITSGKVNGKKIDRGPGVTSFLIEREVDNTRPTFTLEIEYQPAPTVN